MKNKNILIFSLAYYPFVWWAEVAWKEITDRIHEYSFDMVVAKMKKWLKFKEKIGNVTVYRVWFWLSSIDKLLYSIIAPIFWSRLFFKKKYLLCVWLMASFWWLVAAFCRLLLGKKVYYILNLQDGDTDEYINKKIKGKKFLYRFIFRRADHITVLAEFLKKRAYGYGYNKKVTIIPNGVDTHKFFSYVKNDTLLDSLKHVLWIEKNDKVIVTTSRLNYKNWIDDIILSLTHLPQNYKFLCLWEGEDRHTLESLIQKNNLQKRVMLLWYVSHDKILDYLSLSDFFCRPSLQEWFWNSFVEAMAFRLPVVATPVWWIVDFLKDGETWYFCAVKEPKSIADAVLKFDVNKDKTKKILDNAQNMVIEKYNRDTIAQSYKHLFDSL